MEISGLESWCKFSSPNQVNQIVDISNLLDFVTVFSVLFSRFFGVWRFVLLFFVFSFYYSKKL